MANTCTDLTEAARAVQLFKINGFTATKEKPEFIASRTWTVGGHDWQIDFEPNGRDKYNKEWMKMRFSLASAGTKVAASFSCRLVHPDPSSRAPPLSQEKTVSSVFHQNTFVDVLLAKRVDLESSGFVKDESFLVQCAVNVLLGVGESSGAAAVMGKRCSDLQKDLGELLRIQKGADVTFLVSGESVAARRCVLVARSPVFAAALLGEKASASRCVEVKDVEDEVFKAMLHFIYTDTSPPELEKQGKQTAALARQLLEAADRYGLERLKRVCVEKVCTSISVGTVAAALALAEQHGCSKLKDTCVDFILANLTRFHEIAATEGYKHLEASCPSALTELLKLMLVHQRYK